MRGLNIYILWDHNLPKLFSNRMGFFFAWVRYLTDFVWVRFIILYHVSVRRKLHYALYHLFHCSYGFVKYFIWFRSVAIGINIRILSIQLNWNSQSYVVRILAILRIMIILRFWSSCLYSIFSPNVVLKRRCIETRLI